MNSFLFSAGTFGRIVWNNRLLNVFFQLLLQTKYLNVDGSPKLHVIQECPRHYYLTYITRKDWPFLPKFNKILYRLAEGGFTKLWQDSTSNTLIQVERARQVKEPEIYQAFSLKNVKTPFYMLLIGYMLSIIVFLIERILPPEKLERILKRLGLLNTNRRARLNRR